MMSFSKARGVGLIEVLVAMAISAIGLLALLSTQATALRQTKLTQYRAIATQLATDLAERMRANNTDSATPVYYRFPVSFADQARFVAEASVTCNSRNTPCATPQQLALFDKDEWRQAVRNMLPNGSVHVVPDGGAAKVVNVWIAWRDPAVRAADEQVLTQGPQSSECPRGLGTADDPAVRCLYMRVPL